MGHIERPYVIGRQTTEFTFTLNGKQAEILRALCQNPHDAYRDNSELMKFSEDMFTQLTDIMEGLGIITTKRGADFE